MTINRAILIAAGRGKRLGPHTEDIPKCMVEVGARPILGWVWEAFAAAGVEELVVIRGYKGDVLEPDDNVMGIGSGGNFALAAARALLDSDLDAEAIARKAMAIAADICVYTNKEVVIESLESKS